MGGKHCNSNMQAKQAQTTPQERQTYNAQGLVSRGGSAGLLDGCKLRSGIGLGNGVDAGDLGGTGSVLWCGVATTRLLVAATREDNEACLVVLQAGDVGLLGCHAAVATAGIDSDSYGLGIPGSKAASRQNKGKGQSAPPARVVERSVPSLSYPVCNTYLRLMPAAESSSRVKPRPTRTLRL